MQYDDHSVKLAFDAINRREDKLQKNISEFRESLMGAGMAAAGMGWDHEVQAVRDAYIRVLEAENDVKAYRQSLHHAKQAYTGSGTTTDFANLLNTHMEAFATNLQAGFPACPELRQFDEAVGFKPTSMDDEDVVLDEENLSELQCAISKRKVLDLADPVEDQHGWVYERAAIVDYIRSQGGRAPTPQAGAMYSITVQDLRVSHKVLRAKRRAMLTASQVPATQEFVLEA